MDSSVPPEAPADGWMTARPVEPGISRGFAAVQVFLVCGVPTQLFVALVLAFFGRSVPIVSDSSAVSVGAPEISLEFFAMTSLLDTALIAVLIRIFFAMSRESSHQVLLGSRPIGREIVRGLALVPLLLLLVSAVIYTIMRIAPVLHNVPKNPLEAYMDTPLKAGVLLIVVVLAGGVREELQRGFILHRFDQRLGGVWLGLAVFSVAFGLMHLVQGIDVAIAVGLLGLIWGLIYVRRRSVVAAMTSHAGFDVAQVLLRSLST